MVFASTPVASLRRFAARPVGAHSKQRSFFARRTSRMLNTNLRAPFFLAQKIVQPMIRQKWGRIISISSQCGLIAIENHVAYCASKGGMELMTKVCALEWAPYGVT